MENFASFLAELLSKTFMAIITSLAHNWLPLSLAILTAVLIKVFVDTEKLKKILLGKPKISIFASVAFGAFTPLCACGTMAVIIGLLTTTLPWGPIMAFLTSSPLMSPDGFILLAGVVGIKFAVALTAASVIIGLGSGYITHLIEIKTGFLKNQTRFSGTPKAQSCCSNPSPVPAQACGCPASAPAPVPAPVQACSCSAPVPAPAPACGCSGSAPAAAQVQSDPVNTGLLKKSKIKELGDAFVSVGLKQILLFFSIFVGVGYLINYFVPTSIIMALFSPDSIFSVPLAALIGFPLYVTGESAIPLINALMAGGAGGGAMLAFMITGQATSAWVIAGITAFMKRRVIGLYITFILAGGILLGYLYDLILVLGL